MEEKNPLPLSPEERNFLQHYKKELEHLKLLEEAAVLELCRKAEEFGDSFAKAGLTEQFLPEVLRLAEGYCGQGLMLGDLVQEGNVGLMLAIETLGMRAEGCTAREYLLEEIRTAMEQAVESNRAERRAGDLLAGRLNDLKDQIEKLSEELEGQVSMEELSAYADMPAEEIVKLLKLAGEGKDL